MEQFFAAVVAQAAVLILEKLAVFVLHLVQSAYEGAMTPATA